MTSALATTGTTPSRTPLPAAASTRPGQGSTLRLLPVPDAEPPFDDECTPAQRVRALRSAPLRRSPGRVGPEPAAVPNPQPTSPAAGNTAGHATAETATAAADLLGPRRAGTPIAPLIHEAVPEMSQAGDVGVRHTATSGLPPAGRVSSVLGRAVIEALAGTRPLEQLRIHCTPSVYAGLERQPRISGGRALRLQSAHVCQPADGVAEVAAVFRLGDRARAMAFRLVGMDGRWRITALQVG